VADNDDDNIPPPPPPPPRPEPDAFAPQDIFQSDADAGGQQMDSGKPSVAASPTRVFVVLGAMGALLMYLLYNIFFSGAGYDQDDSIAEREVAERNARPIAPAPPPPLVEEQLPPPAKLAPPPIPEPTQLPEIRPEDDDANNKALLDRLKSNMMIFSGGGSLFGGDTAASETELAAMDPNSQFGALVKRSTSKAEKVSATHIGDLSRIIAQGRLIQATLETVINTDLPGPIRAIVSRDVFAEAGTTPLIPKGSRLIGQYNSNIVAGQSRVYVMWTRVIRPDGVDIALGSPLTDQIGQAGIGGFVDNKFREMFSRSVLASIFSIVVALGVDQIQGDEESQTSSTISPDGTISQSGSAASSASVNALNRLGSITGSFISRFINLKPTILVDQGSQVMVFVNRDLVFPAELVGSQNIP
jgi:type IV secretion system protein VirB10